MKRHAAPIIAAILLLLPLLYVGSYLLLVVPERIEYSVSKGVPSDSVDAGLYPNYLSNYRFRGNFLEEFFWPLEQIDRKVRPGAWSDFDLRIPDRKWEDVSQ